MAINTNSYGIIFTPIIYVFPQKVVVDEGWMKKYKLMYDFSIGAKVPIWYAKVDSENDRFN